MSTTPCSGTLNSIVGFNQQQQQLPVYERSHNDAQHHAEAAHPTSLIDGMQQLTFNGNPGNGAQETEETGVVAMDIDDEPAPPQQLWIHAFVQHLGLPALIAVHLAALGFTDLASLWTHRAYIPPSIADVAQEQYESFKTALVSELRQQGLIPVAPAPTVCFPPLEELLTMMMVLQFIDYTVNNAQQDGGVYKSYRTWDGTATPVAGPGNQLNGAITKDGNALRDLEKWWSKGPALIKTFMDARTRSTLLQSNKNKRDNDNRQERMQKDQRSSMQQQARRDRDRAAKEAAQAHRQRMAQIEMSSSMQQRQLK